MIHIKYNIDYLRLLYRPYPLLPDNATSPHHARMDEPGLMFDSEISRMLIDAGHLSQLALNRKKPAVPPCGRPPKYATCLDQANGKKPPPLCGTYDRICR
jgi:hypothetical protein